MLEVLRNIVQEVNAAESLDEALDIIVDRVRVAMGTEVCSVYMAEPGGERLVFCATQGLNAEQVGVASLASGQGLVGLVAEREEPVNLENAESHPSFQFLPGIGEEPFHAFLGVPIIHQRDVLGVLVIQQKERTPLRRERRGFPGHTVGPVGRGYCARPGHRCHRRGTCRRRPGTGGESQWYRRCTGNRYWRGGSGVTGGRHVCRTHAKS